MRNHDEKARDMAASVLPSTAPARARAFRRAAHHGHRAAQHTQLRQIELVGRVEFDPSLDRERHRELDWMVGARRSKDKVGPLIRWARVRLHRDPELQKLSVDQQVLAIGRDLPPGLIGRHAMDHIRWALEGDRRRAEWAARRREGLPVERIAELAEQCLRIIERGRHGEFNAAIRAIAQREEAAALRHRQTPPTPPRPLAGLHDIEAFAAEHYTHVGVRLAAAELGD